ncbi:AAA family ATPase [Micromonosporaceae bacterium Da 78-11]
MRYSALIDPGTDLIGREPELARIRHCLEPATGRRPALLITGERGAGKSRLLAAAVQLAGEDGRHRILTVRPQPGTALSASALVRYLLLAVRHDLPDLPGPLGRAALAFLGLAAGPAPSDVTVPRSALAAALTAIGRISPVLIAADDVHRLTPDAADVLAKLSATLATVLLAGAAGRIPAVLAGLPGMPLRPLHPLDAARLLDAQDNPPTGRARAHLLRRCAGNPAALIELTEQVPEGGLLAAFAADVDRLDEPVRRLLLHLAAATSPADPRTMSTAAGVTADAAWRAAETAGLVVRTRDSVAFTHPLIGEAVYRNAPAHLRVQAHQALTTALAAAPEQRAWHRAAATSGRDEEVAAGLEAAAGIFRGRGAVFEATAAMEQAAERSPQPQSAARRYAQAVADARDLGEADWAGELHATVRRMTADPDLIAVAARAAATALSRSGRQHEAYGLLAAARRAGPPGDRRTALSLAGQAASIAGISGHEEHRLGLLPMLASAGTPTDEAVGTFIRLIIDPASHPGRAICAATVAPDPGTPSSPPARHRLAVIGTIAWYEDQSRLAVDLLSDTVGAGPARRSFPPGTEALPVLATALIDTGDWARADRHVVALDSAGLPLMNANLAALRAQLFALRGDSDQALRLAHRTWQHLDVEENRSTHVRLLRAAAQAAVNSGDYENGYRCLRSMFDSDGRALHSFIAGRCIAELAAAAARNGRRADTRTVLDRVRADAGAAPSTRMRLLLHLSEALLDESERAEHHFRLATVDPAGHEWPYERALARLHYGEWLRRARRPRDARALLSAASSAFVALGAVHAAELADRELRASGRPDEPTAGAGLDVLTPQERQVAQLAARGLRNREIAEQLFISVRTVGAHLYSVYPKLGISGRHQLRDTVTRD